MKRRERILLVWGLRGRWGDVNFSGMDLFMERSRVVFFFGIKRKMIIIGKGDEVILRICKGIWKVFLNNICYL